MTGSSPLGGVDWSVASALGLGDGGGGGGGGAPQHQHGSGGGGGGIPLQQQQQHLPFPVTGFSVVENGSSAAAIGEADGIDDVLRMQPWLQE